MGTLGKHDKARHDGRSHDCEGGCVLLGVAALAAIPPIMPISARSLTADQRHAARLVSERDESGRARDVAQAEKDIAQRGLDQAVEPEGFGLALQVLTYLAVVSIAAPLTAMLPASLEMDLLGRSVLTGLFLSGVALLLLYLFAYASTLRKNSGREALPRTVFGLFVGWRKGKG